MRKLRSEFRIAFVLAKNHLRHSNQNIEMRMLLSIRNFKTYYVGPPRKVAVDLCYKFLSNKNVSGPGKKSPIFLLHDLLTSKCDWTSVGGVISAKTKRHVMAVDMRNHGQSPHADSHDYIDLTLDILKLLNKLDIKKATFLGHSIGGRSAMVTALKQPKIVDNLIVVDVSPTAKPIPNTEYLMKLLDAMSFVDFKGVTSVIEAIHLAEKSLRSIAEDEKALNALLTNIGQNPDNTFAWVCNVNALKQYLPSIATFPKELEDCVYTGPTLFVLGEKSDFVQPHDMSAIRRYFPSCKVEYVPDAGHNVHSDNPAKFVELVVDFLK